MMRFLSGQIASPWLRGVRNGAGLPALVLMASLIGIGGLARDVGYPMWAGVLSTLLIWAGPAQVLLFGSLASGQSLAAIAITVSLSSIRFFPMVVSIMPLLKGPGVGTGKLLFAAHFSSVTPWVEARRALPDMPAAERYPYFIGFSLTVMFAASIATGAGYYLIAALPPALAAGLLFMTPIFFTLQLVAAARGLADALAIVLGFALTPVAVGLVGRDFDLLVAGLVGGTIAYAIHRARRAPA